MGETAQRDSSKATWVLALSTLAFTGCFAVWTLFSILGIKIQAEYGLSAGQFGMLLALPILVGSVGRLPVGMLTDRFGGRVVFSTLLALIALPTFLLSFASTYEQFLACGAGLGLAGAGFAVGAAYVSCWAPREKRGTALGIFGMGNTGSALTAFMVPYLLAAFTDWRMVPRLYAGMLLILAVLFFLTGPHRAEHCVRGVRLGDRLKPLSRIRVWRFGLYYFLLFGGFVGLGLWLPNYFKNVYGLSLGQIALITQAFLLPAAFVRVLGGWLSDRFGARPVMYMVLGTSIAAAAVLAIPHSEYTVFTVPYQFQPPGFAQPVYYQISTNKFNNTTTTHIVGVGKLKDADQIHDLLSSTPKLQHEVDGFLTQVESGKIVPEFSRRTIPFVLDVRLFTLLLFVLGTAMGIGMGAVYTYIPQYYPQEVGVVGGIVGMIGGLGGFCLPIVWGYVLEWTGMYPVTLFAIICLLAALSLGWLHYVVRKHLEPAENGLAITHGDVPAARGLMGSLRKEET